MKLFLKGKSSPQTTVKTSEVDVWAVAEDGQVRLMVKDENGNSNVLLIMKADGVLEVPTVADWVTKTGIKTSDGRVKVLFNGRELK